MKRKRKVLVDEVAITMRDFEVLKFLWRWKVSTTACLATAFFPEATAKTAYNRLWTLSRSGLIESKVDQTGKHHLWMVSTEGARRVQSVLPTLRDAGFKSEYPKHDLICSALHNGEWLLKRPEGIEYYSEQQLRRIHSDVYPSWVPRAGSHRPDGYWKIPLAEKEKAYRVLAMEVELHHKSSRDYEYAIDFYHHYSRIDGVLWLVKREAQMEKLLELTRKRDPKDAGRHKFVFWREFENRGWHSPIHEIQTLNQKVRTVFDWLTDLAPEVCRNSATICPGKSLVPLILNTRKCPVFPLKNETQSLFPPATEEGVKGEYIYV